MGSAVHISGDALTLDVHLATLLQKAIEVTLCETFAVSLSLEAWSIDKTPLSLDSYVTCLIHMREEDKERGDFIIAFSRETLAKVMKSYGITDMSNPAVFDDAAMEIANMIYGLVKTNLNKMGYKFQMGIPVAIDEKNRAPMQDGSDKMIQPFLADGHKGRVVVAQKR